VELERNEAFNRMRNNEHQIFMWANDGSELIYAFPRHAIPVDPVEAFMGPEIAKWYASVGTQGTEPADPNMKRILELFRSAAGQQDEQRNLTAREIWKILVDQQYTIGTVGQSPAFMGTRLTNRRLANIPARACIAQHCRTPGTSRPETWVYKT
jgi:peptide/nickel transport system substrate-binding protein